MESEDFTPELRPGEKPPLRIMLFQMGLMLSSGSDARSVDGLSKDSFLDFCSYFNQFNHSFVWTFDRTLFGTKKNGTYTGVLGQIMDNEGDAFILPLPMLPVAEGVVEYGPPLMASPTVIVTVPNVVPHDDEVLTQLFRFKTEIVILLMIAVYLFARIINKSEGRVQTDDQKYLENFFEGVWKIMELMLLQSNFTPVTASGKALFMLTSIGVAFWYILWQNEMKSDMVSYDTSRIIETMDDLLRSNLTFFLMSRDPTENLMASKARMDPTSSIAQVYRRATIFSSANPEGGAGHIMSITSPETLRKTAIISTQLILQLFRAMVCLSSQDLQFFVASDTFFHSPFSPWINPRYPKPWKKMLFDRFVRMRENGIVDHTWNEISQDSANNPQLKAVKESMDPEAASRQCIFTSIKTYIEQMGKDEFVTLRVEHYDSAFRLLLMLYWLALIIFMIEKSGIIESASEKYRVLKDNKSKRKIADINLIVPKKTESSNTEESTSNHFQRKRSEEKRVTFSKVYKVIHETNRLSIDDEIIDEIIELTE